MDADGIGSILRDLAGGGALGAERAERAFELVMSGEATPAQIASLLTALSVRPGGPTTEEITGAARAMRNHVRPVEIPDGLTVIDTCGTGGDATGTFNVSTAAALIAAGAGAHVAKHGNRSVTSNSGSSQVLEALGVNLQAELDRLTRCLAEAGLCFCFAPSHHPAMKHAAPVRKELGFRTVFNLLGPLTNPAGARRQVVGVYGAELTDALAEVLLNLGAEHAMVVHGQSPEGGLDELTTTGPSRVAVVRDGKVTSSTLAPEELGLERARLDDLRVESVEKSARLIRSILDGQEGPARDIAALNAGAALVVAGLASELSEGLAQAQEAIDAGRAGIALEKLVEITNE